MTGSQGGGEGASVRLTEDAVEDLRRLAKKDPQIVRWCFKKMIMLERDPEAGEALLGGLIGFRKLTVGDRHWRIVWRVVQDVHGVTTVDVAEVSAAGVRSDDEVYDEMVSRVAALDADSPRARALNDVIASMGRVARDLAARPGPVAPEALAPDWLVDNLVRTLGVSRSEAAAMGPTAAMADLQAFWERGERSGNDESDSEPGGDTTHVASPKV